MAAWVVKYPSYGDKNGEYFGVVVNDVEGELLHGKNFVVEIRASGNGLVLTFAVVTEQMRRGGDVRQFVHDRQGGSYIMRIPCAKYVPLKRLPPFGRTPTKMGEVGGGIYTVEIPQERNPPVTKTAQKRGGKREKALPPVTLLQIKEAVQVLNRAKNEMGAELYLTVDTSTNKLAASVNYV